MKANNGTSAFEGPSLELVSINNLVELLSIINKEEEKSNFLIGAHVKRLDEVVQSNQRKRRVQEKLAKAGGKVAKNPMDVVDLGGVEVFVDNLAFHEEQVLDEIVKNLIEKVKWLRRVKSIIEPIAKNEETKDVVLLVKLVNQIPSQIIVKSELGL